MSAYMQNMILFAEELRHETSVDGVIQILKELQLVDKKMGIEQLEIENIGIPDLDKFFISNKVILNGTYIPDITYVDKINSPVSIDYLFCVDTNIHGIQFCDRDISRAAFINRQKQNVVPQSKRMDNSRLTDVMFYGNDMSGTVGSNCILNNVLMHNCIIKHIRFDGYRVDRNGCFEISSGPDASTSKIAYSVFVNNGADNGLHVFKGIKFRDCRFENIASVHLSNTSFKRCKFTSCYLEPNFREELSKGNKRKQEFIECEFVGERISQTLINKNHIDFSKSVFSAGENVSWFTFENIDFTNCKFSETEFRKCQFINCLFPAVESKHKSEKFWIKYENCEFTNTEFSDYQTEYIENCGENDWAALEDGIRVIFDNCSFDENQTNSTFLKAKFIGGNIGSAKNKIIAENVKKFKKCVFCGTGIYPSAGAVSFEGCHLKETLFRADKRIMITRKSCAGWNISFYYSIIDSCSYENVKWPGRTKEAFPAFSRVDFINGTKFNKCNFNGIDYKHCNIDSIVMCDCHKDINEKKITITKSMLKNIRMEGKIPKNGKLDIEMRKAVLSKGWLTGFGDAYREQGFFGDAWFEEEREDIEKLQDKKPLQDWGATSLSPAKRFYQLFEKNSVLNKIRHIDGDLGECKNDPSKMREILNKTKKAIELNSEVKKFLSETSYEVYKNKIEQFYTKLQEFSRKQKSGIEIIDEYTDDLRENYYSWRALVVLRISGKVIKDYLQLNYFDKWLEGCGKNKMFEISSYPTPGTTSTTQKIYMDFHKFKMLLKIISINAISYSNGAYASVCVEEDGTILSVALYDKGKGFDTESDLNRLLDKLSEFQKFVKEWCRSATLKTVIGNDIIKIDLRNGGEKHRETSSSNERIGTEYVYEIELTQKPRDKRPFSYGRHPAKAVD